MLQRAVEVHGDLYDYSKSEYIRNDYNIIIGCKIHGDFSQTPSSHVSTKRGCPKCGRERTTSAIISSKGITWDRVLVRAYKLGVSIVSECVGPINYNLTLNLSCPTHGVFSKTVRQFFTRSENRACFKCSRDYGADLRRNSIDKVSKTLLEIYGDRYDFPYLGKEYKDSHSKITGVCGTHGEFASLYYDQVTKNVGCPKCKGDETSVRLSLKFGEWLDYCNKKYSSKYDYSLVDWDTRYCENLNIVCPSHGSFLQNWKDHAHGCVMGCPKCAVNFSKGEEVLASYIGEIYRGVILRNWTGLLLSNLEADIFLPEINLAIEYNGLHFHSSRTKDSNYHTNKRRAFNREGIRVIQIWEDEFKNNKEVVKAYLRNVLNKDITKIYARKCLLIEVSSDKATIFLDENHLLGSGGSASTYLGLNYDGELVCLMAFKKGYSGWELQRMANKIDTSVVGGFSKLLTNWRRSNPLEDLVSYVDLDKFEGGAYYKNGFQYVTENRTLHYVYKDKRVSKFKFRRKELAKILGGKFNPGASEKENCRINKIHQIWNSGTVTLKLPKYNEFRGPHICSLPPSLESTLPNT
jgi:hypothetical protein